MAAVITFLVILSVLVLVHELGHFLLARHFKIKVEEFGFGYPPRVIGKKIGETIYSINLLPFGGFVKMLGEDSGEQVRDKGELKRAFFRQTKSVRFGVIIAGVVMNFLLGVGLFAAVYTKLGIPEEVDYLTVTGIVKDSPAEASGLILEDKILGIEGLEWVEDKTIINQFIDYLDQHRGVTVKLTIVSSGVTEVVEVVPRLKEETPEGQGALGVVITSVDLVQYPVWQRPFRGAWVGLKEAVGWGREILASLGMLGARLAQGEVPKDVAGPVGIFEVSKQFSEEGFLAVLQFMGILSINLSILNLLPIPALDGGRLVFVMIEVVARRRVKPQVEQMIHLVGMALLLGLMALVTIQDIRRLTG